MTNDDKRLEEIEERKKLLLQGHAVECSYTLVPQHYICNCGYSDAFEAFPLDAAYLTNRVRDAEKEIGVQKAIAETRREQRDDVAVERDRLLGALRSVMEMAASHSPTTPFSDAIYEIAYSVIPEAALTPPVTSYTAEEVAAIQKSFFQPDALSNQTIARPTVVDQLVDHAESEEVTGPELQEVIDAPAYKLEDAMLPQSEVDGLFGRITGHEYENEPKEGTLDNCTYCGCPDADHEVPTSRASCHELMAARRREPTEVE